MRLFEKDENFAKLTRELYRTEQNLKECDYEARDLCYKEYELARDRVDLYLKELKEGEINE